MTTIYLVRHGETTWNRDRRIQGHQDSPLTETGIEQAQALANRLAEVSFDIAYASDSGRTGQTAEILVRGRPLVLISLPTLREVNLGRWEGRLVPEIEESDPDNWSAWRDGTGAPHGGETDDQLERRVIGALEYIVRTHPKGTVLVVTHGGPIRAALRAWLGVDQQRIPNCGVYIIEADERHRRLVDVVEPGSSGDDRPPGGSGV